MKNTTVILGILLLVPGAAQAQVSVADKAILRTGKLKLEIHYPEIGRAEIDRIFSEAARNYAADPDLNETSEGQNSGSMSYKIKRNDAVMFSVQVSTYSYYAGHAHGMPGMQSYNFLMPGADQVFLPELVDGRRGLERVSELAVADLTRQLEGGDPDSIRIGASPQALSWTNFAWLPDALELTFPPYEVAGYAEGTKTVNIAFSDIADVIRPDPRAPAPSFSCSGAGTAIEKTICSDAALARLDRQVGERYAIRLARVPAAKPNEKPQERQYREDEQVHHTAQVASQRAWLAQRNKMCVDASKACLTASYQARQAALFKNPF